MDNNRERLEQIEKAITAIETTGQEYQIGSRRLKRGDLGLLYQERRALQSQIAQENGCTTTVAVCDGR